MNTSKRRAEKSPPIKSTKALIDFAIITPMEIERRAVCEAFGLTDRNRVPIGSRIYWHGSLPLNNGYYYEVVVAQSPDMANIDAALLTSDTIRDWEPSALLMAGVAGATSDEVALGDLVLGHDVYYYERGKVTAKGKKPEPIMYRADATLWGRAVALPKWAASIPIRRPDRRKGHPKIHHGVIASGEKVIAEKAARNQIAESHRKILAIEMEGHGFSTAVWQSFTQRRHLVIRAICDRADRSKNENWQPYAAAVAAGFAKHFLLDRPLEPRNSPTLKKKVLPDRVWVAPTYGGDDSFPILSQRWRHDRRGQPPGALAGALRGPPPAPPWSATGRGKFCDKLGKAQGVTAWTQ